MNWALAGKAATIAFGAVFFGLWATGTLDLVVDKVRDWFKSDEEEAIEEDRDRARTAEAADDTWDTTLRR